MNSNAGKLAYQHSGAEAAASSSQRRRAGSRGPHAAPSGLRSNSSNSHSSPTRASQPPGRSTSRVGTSTLREADEDRVEMSLDRTPSPQPSGGWASPGLDTPYESTRVQHFASESLSGGSNSSGSRARNPISWENAKASSARVNGFPSWKSQNEGFFGRHMRRISSGLPVFMNGGHHDRFEIKEKPLRTRTGDFPMRSLSWKNLRSMTWREIGLEMRNLPNRLPKSFVTALRKNRTVFGLLIVLITLLLWFQSGKCPRVHSARGRRRTD